MNIQSVELTNFQKHTHLFVEFTNGVNLIHGESGVGKSCLIRSIRFCLFNDPLGDSMRKEGTALTTVIVKFDDGLIVTRQKGNSVNRYILQIGDSTKTYDDIGKSIPKEVAESLRLTQIEIAGEDINLNFSKQLDAPFLFCEKGSFRMKLFNRLTGTDVLDSVLQDYNKEKISNSKLANIAQARKVETDDEIKSVEIMQEARVAKFNKLKEILSVLIELKNKYDSVKKLQEAVHQAVKTSENLSLSIWRLNINKLDETIKLVSGRLAQHVLIANKYKEIQQHVSNIGIYSGILSKYPDGLQAKLNGLRVHIDNFKSVSMKIVSAKKINCEVSVNIATISKCKFADTSNIKIMLDDYSKVGKLYRAIIGFDVTRSLNASNAKQYEEDLKKLVSSKEAIYKKFSVCPFCKSSIDERKIKELCAC